MADGRATDGNMASDDPVVARVRQLLELARQHAVDELRIEAGDFKLTLRTRSPGVVVGPGPTPRPPPPLPEAEAPAAATHHEITAPMIGTFYSAPGPDEPSFVSVGDTIEPGQTVAIIEAMKIMNEIQSDQRGVLVEVLARSGQGVEFGQPLFRLRPTEPAGR